MKVFYTTEFSGHWPVGTAAVVVAENAEQAYLMLKEELKNHSIGLAGQDDFDASSFSELNTRYATAVVLNDGDY